MYLGSTYACIVLDQGNRLTHGRLGMEIEDDDDGGEDGMEGSAMIVRH